MQITTFSDYCLRILIFLAVSEGRKTTAREIAERYNISTHHVAKASQWLVREGHVSAMRGKGGGLRLARDPHDINIGHVIRKAEEGTGLVECMRGSEPGCAIAPACGLSSILDEARVAFFETLEKYSVADATKRRSGLARLLQLTTRESA